MLLSKLLNMAHLPSDGTAEWAVKRALLQDLRAINAALPVSFDIVTQIEIDAYLTVHPYAQPDAPDMHPQPISSFTRH